MTELCRRRSSALLINMLKFRTPLILLLFVYVLFLPRIDHDCVHYDVSVFSSRATLEVTWEATISDALTGITWGESKIFAQVLFLQTL